MRIQNKNLAGAEMTLRFTHDQDGNRVKVRADDRGIFEMPERDAQQLLQTPGWAPIREASLLESEPELPPVPAASTPKPAGLRPAAPGPAAPPIPPPTVPTARAAAVVEDAEAAEASALKAEVEGLRSKADALAFAELHEVTGLTAEMKLSEMKELLTSALFEVVEAVTGEES